MSEERVEPDEASAHARFMGDIGVAIASLIFGAWVVWYSQGLPPAPGGGSGSGLFPTIIGSVLAGVGIFLGGRTVAGALTRRSPEPSAVPQAMVLEHGSADLQDKEKAECERDGAPDLGRRRRRSNAFAALGAIALYVVLIEPLGFIITMSLVQFGLLLKFGNKVLPSVAISAISTAMLYLVFGQLLFVPLQSGLLG